MKQEAIKEQLVKTVVKSGNGGAVWVPKAWLGEEVIVILPQKPGIKERVLHLLEPYLKDVLAVGIYGSHARKEQTKESDIDVLVIADKKIFLKEPGVEILSLSPDSLKRAVEKHPALYFQPVQEAEPLINAPLFEELRRIRPSKEGIRAFIKDTKGHLKSSRELVELDKLDGNLLKSASVLYSAMLRLKGAYVLFCALKGESFSSKGWKRWLLAKGLSKGQFDDTQAGYRAVRDSLPFPKKLPLSLAETLLTILHKSIGELRDQYSKRLNR